MNDHDRGDRGNDGGNGNGNGSDSTHHAPAKRQRQDSSEGSLDSSLISTSTPAVHSGSPAATPTSAASASASKRRRLSYTREAQVGKLRLASGGDEDKGGDFRSQLKLRPQPARQLHPRRPPTLTTLTPELLLRILTHLPLSDLLTCTLLSHALHTVTHDPSLWRLLYTAHFPPPIPRPAPSSSSSRADNPSAKKNNNNNSSTSTESSSSSWKSLFRLRWNWTYGHAQRLQLQHHLQSDLSHPPLQTCAALLHHTLITYDVCGSLHAWSARGNLLCTISDAGPGGCAVLATFSDPRRSDVSGYTGDCVALGCKDGSCKVFGTKDGGRGLEILYTLKQRPEEVGIKALALRMPYLLTLDEGQVLRLYVLEGEGKARLLWMLAGTSAAVLEPLSLSLSLGSVVKPNVPSKRPHDDHPAEQQSELSIRIVSYIPTLHPLSWLLQLQTFHLDPSSGTLLSSSLVHGARAARRPLALGYLHPFVLLGAGDNGVRTARAGGKGRSRLGDGDGNGREKEMVGEVRVLGMGAGRGARRDSAGDASIGSAPAAHGMHGSRVEAVAVGGWGKGVSVGRGGEVRVWEVAESRSTRARRGLSQSGKQLAKGVRLGMAQEGVKIGSSGGGFYGADSGMGSTAVQEKGERSGAREGEGEGEGEVAKEEEGGEEEGDGEIKTWIGFNDEVVVVLDGYGAEGTGAGAGARAGARAGGNIVIYNFT